MSNQRIADKPIVIARIVKGDFKGYTAQVLTEQKADLYPTDKRIYGYTLKLPSSWILNVPEDYVQV